jgi:hypothetical protein
MNDKLQKFEQEQLSLRHDADSIEDERLALMIEILDNLTNETLLPATHPTIRNKAYHLFAEKIGLKSYTAARRYYNKCKDLVNNTINMKLVFQKSLKGIYDAQGQLQDIADKIDPTVNPETDFYSDKIKAVSDKAKLHSDILNACLKSEKNLIDVDKNAVSREKIASDSKLNAFQVNFQLEGTMEQKIKTSAQILSKYSGVLEGEVLKERVLDDTEL